jgi:dynein heavy chain, axonemal
MSGGYMLQDDRVKWIRQRVAVALEIPTESIDAHFSQSSEAAQSLSDFMTSKYATGSAMFFSCNKWVEEIEIEDEIEIIDKRSLDEQDLYESPTGTDEQAGASEETKTASSALDREATAAENITTDIDGENVNLSSLELGGEDGTENRVVRKPAKKTMLVKRLVNVDRYILYFGVEKMTPEMNDRPTVYFIRCNDGDVPKSTENGNLNSHFEFSSLTGGVLYGIANLMHQVYAPVVSKGTVYVDNTAATEIDDALRHELGASIKKFEQQLRHVVQQSRGDVRLSLPNIVITSAEASAADPVVVDEIERALEDWTVVIAGANETEHQKVNRTQRTPLGEIDFWRERSASLSALYEQIGMPRVQQMIQVMKIVDSPQLGSFNFHFGELTKIFLEAKDNVKFLTTVERHFRHMSEGNFQTILDSMQSMMNGLRMVWVISRHYNSDERMAPLMETIACTLVRRVQEGVRLSEVLSMESKAAKKHVQEARAVLTQWSENYFRMRKRIEDSGSDHRWEFERKALFGKTDYMSDVCANILEIVEALDHFKVFLGPELKAVTGDAEGIDEVLKRVDGLSDPLKIPFEEKIFDKAYEKPWEVIMRRFRGSVAEIEKMTEVFIKESFRKLRSAEGAFELVQNFQKIGADDSSDTGGSQIGGGQPVAGSSIKQQISNRYDDILEQYVHELEALKQLFKTDKEKPPLYKNYPPVAGSIAWARDLYQRAKRPILRFKNHGGLLDDEFGDKVKLNYLEFARMVDTYVSELFSDWEQAVAVLAGERLKLPVLRSIANYVPPTKQQEKEGIPFVLPPPPYRVSFSHDLKMIIKESRYLDKLGFRIPESALNVTLQESKYLEISRSLNAQLQSYDQLMASLKPVEKVLLKSHIDDLNATIKTGFSPLNWTSQRIPQYIEDLIHALLKFSSVVSQVHKNASMIQDIVSHISKTLLVQGKDFQSADGQQLSLDITEFYEIVEVRRVSRLEALVEEYRSIGESFLMKVEEVVAKTATGCSPVLSGYYHYWEKCVYNSIAQMAIASMAALMGLLQCKDSPPLFKVLVTLNGNDMVVSPALPDVDKQLTKAVRNMAESSKFFIRWMYGTCIRTDAQIVNEDEEPYIFSFFQDISKNPQVVKLTLSLTSQTNKVYNMTNKYLDGWRRYDKVTGLWNPKRKQQIEKLRPTCANLDSAMNYFRGIRETVDSQPVSKDIDFLQIDMTLVAAGVARQSEIWKNDYGEVLLTTSRSMLSKLRDKITDLESDIASETNDLEQLKFVLNVVAEIQTMTQDMELEMMDIKERYCALDRYSIDVPILEMEAAMNIEARWRQLYCDSRTRDLRLVDTKDKFRAVTATQDRNFRETLAELRRQFLGDNLFFLYLFLPIFHIFLSLFSLLWRKVCFKK